MKRCPECGNPPAYTSFCTRCARLFFRSYKPRRTAMQIRIQYCSEAQRRLDEWITAAYRASASTSAMAHLLGMPRNTANYHRNRLKLPEFPREYALGKTRSAPDPRLVEAIADGLTAKQTAALLGRSYLSITRARAQHRLPSFARAGSHRKGKRHPLADRVAALRAAGRSYSQVAAQLGIGRGSVAQIVRDHIKPRQESPRHEIRLSHLRTPGCPAGIADLPAFECSVAGRSRRRPRLDAPAPGAAGPAGACSA